MSLKAQRATSRTNKKHDANKKKKSDILLGNVALNMFSSSEDLSVYVLLLKHVVNTYFHAAIKFSIESTSAVILHFAYGTI